MAVPMYDPKELTVIGEEAGFLGRTPPTPVYDYPVTKKEAMKVMFRREPYWQMTSSDSSMMTPNVNPDNLARGFVFDAEHIKPIIGRTVPDMFGIHWEFIEKVNGAMVRPGKPFAEDANDLLKKLVWPEPDKWDWEGSGKINNGVFLKPDNYNKIGFLNGWFERLISMLDFENALMALYDEDQKDAVNEFFTRLSDLYINIFGHMIDTYPDIDGFSIHDDWGGQRNTFFSPELCAEMIVPHMRRVTDFLHSRGMSTELHSCGNNATQVPNMIAAGWDAWQMQPMNDSHALYEQYGDKILISVRPDANIDPEKMSDDELRAAARDFIDRFMKPGKPCFIAFDMSPLSANRPFRDELYEYSRKKCCGMV